MLRVRLDPQNVIRLIRVMIPALVPAFLRGSDMVGKPLGSRGDWRLKRRLLRVIREARKTGQCREADWPSMASGRTRFGIFIPHDDRSVTIRVFASADEAAGATEAT